MKHGESPERMAQMGLLMYQIGEKEKAKDLLESAIQDLPQNTNFYFSLFDLYMDENENEKATKIADQLITSLPEDWRGYYSRSLVYMNEKNFKEVISLLEPVADTFEKIY